MSNKRKYYGEQTELTQKYFPIGEDRWPDEMIAALSLVKFATARANASVGVLNKKFARAIERAAKEVMDGKHADQFPQTVWQGGSGTQFNMNVNEVVAARANELLTGRIAAKDPVHPNNHVNMSQSTNDTVPTAIHIAAVSVLYAKLLPALDELIDTLRKKVKAFGSIQKTGRTHLQDAVSLTLGEEFSGYAGQLEHARVTLIESAEHLKELPIGGTAVGTGLNAPRGYRAKVIAEINKVMKTGFVGMENIFEGMAAHDRIVHVSGALRTLAVAYIKIANDIRWLSSGPKAGLAELHLPANEPGSSIMPGKVNPTQCEQAIMVSAHVIGNDAAIVSGALTLANFELITAKPLLAFTLLDSMKLIADSMRAFEKNAVRDLRANAPRIKELLKASLSDVTVLSKNIGYDKATEVARRKKR